MFRKTATHLLEALLLFSIFLPVSAQQKDIRKITVSEAYALCIVQEEGWISSEVYDLEAVVFGVNHANKKMEGLLNIELTDGNKYIFSYHQASKDSLYYKTDDIPSYGDTLLIRTRLEKFSGVASAYKGYTLNRKKYINPETKLRMQEYELNLVHQRSKYILMLGLVILGLLILGFCIYYYQSRKYTRMLKKQNQEIQRANNFKTQFVQNMSHEVRTPLNAICGFSQLLSNPDYAEMMSKEEKQQYSEIIGSSTELLTNLVNDILDLGDIESGKYRVYLQKMSVNEICHKAMDTVQFRLMGSTVELRFETECSDDFTIQSDPVRVQQILTNYLTNAIKHTSKGSITVSVKPLEGMQARFSVTDTGEGVAPGNAEAIFQRFEKLNTDKKGTGLGLPICRALANCLQGKAYLDTTYTQGGARFNLDL